MSPGNMNPTGWRNSSRGAAPTAGGKSVGRLRRGGFKSCYTAAAVGSDIKLDEYRSHYPGAIATCIAGHPLQTFVST